MGEGPAVGGVSEKLKWRRGEGCELRASRGQGDIF